MTPAQAILFLATLFALPDATGSKAAVTAIAQAAGLPATAWILGRPSERWLEIIGRALAAWGVVPTQAVRGMWFPLSTDPGDVDDFGNPDASADQTPRPGFLGAYGWGMFGTERGGANYATSFVTVKNTGGSVSAPFGPGALFFEASTLVVAGGGAPTYVSTPDGAIYTGPGGTITIAAGASLTIPVQAQQLGSQGSAAVNLIDTCNTQSFATSGPFTVTASTAAIGADREARPLYIARCLRAPNRVTYGAPKTAFLYAMNSYSDGTILQRFDGSGPVTITSGAIYANANGLVTMFVAGAAGMVDSIDVSSATLNICGLVQGVITAPIGVIGATESIGPTTNDPNIIPANTPGVASVTNLTIAVTYGIKVKSSAAGNASPGAYTSGSPGLPPGVAAIFLAIDGGGAGQGALAAYLFSLGAGASDQDINGNGVVYTSMLGVAVANAAPGLYEPIITTPSASTTAVNLGYFPVPGTITGTLYVVSG